MVQVLSEMTMPQALFERFARIAYARAGILLRPGKESLVLSRVLKRMRALGLTDLQVYALKLEQDATGEELVAFLNAISTNVTSFFRESAHFDLLAAFVRKKEALGQARMRFWCAASSTGEEPYSLAMVLDNILQDEVNWRILATDISTSALETAIQGVYGEQSLQSVPAEYRHRYFTRLSEGRWSVAEKLKQRIVFRRVNLAEPPYPMAGPLDVVLCRNVMIYFDDRVREGIVREAERLLAPSGLFITSHTETISGFQTELVMMRPSVHERRG
jgi:chemotaxis protein methyltransferase CheR